MPLARRRLRYRRSLRVVRVASWGLLSIALAALAAASLLLYMAHGHSVAIDTVGTYFLVPLIGGLALVTAGLLVALTRTRGAVKKARADGAKAIQQGEVLRAHLEQQGRTARREAQEHLALIDALFRAAPAGLALYDPELHFVRINQSLAEIHGLSQGAHLGRRLRDLLPAFAPEIERTLQDVLESREVRAVEVTGRTRAGREPRTWLVHCAPVRDAEDDVVGVAQVVLDITERKEAERKTQQLLIALQAEQEVFDVVHRVGQRLAAQLNVGALAQDLADAAAQLSNAESAVFVYASNAIGAMPEYALSGRVQANCTMDSEVLLRLVENSAVRLSELDVEDAGQNLRAALGETGGSIHSLMALPVSHARGPRAAALVVFHSKSHAFSGRDESVLAGLATQAAIALENAHLYGEAQGLIRALAQSNRELDQFAYVASHDLKAPLRGIANIASWLEEDLGDALPKQAREHITLLRSRVSRLENMIGGILRYSRAGRSELAKERVQVAELVHGVVSLLSPPETAVVRIVGEMPTFDAERIPLQQVFLNLIGNALKYSEREDVVVDVSCRAVDHRVEFAVSDNGPGIASDDETHIWELFHGSGGESSGIGLAVVRKTVEARGGQAWVVSQPQQGAAFHFTWPVD